MSCAKHSEHFNAETTNITFDKEEVCLVYVGFFFFSFNWFVMCKLLATIAKFWDVQIQ